LEPIERNVGEHLKQQSLLIGYVKGNFNYAPKQKNNISPNLLRSIKKDLKENCENNSYINLTKIVKEKIAEQGNDFYGRNKDVVHHTIFEIQNRLWGK